VIDPTKEQVIIPTQAAKLFPGTRPGRTMHPNGVIRAMKRGTPTPRGRIHLEHFRFGGRLFTSVEAVQRYIAALSSELAQQAAQTAVRAPSQARRLYDEAEGVLDADGF
jgi:hypothetical protein